MGRMHAARSVRQTRAARSQDTVELTVLRDHVTAQYLRAAAGEDVPDLHVGYSPRWWDGAAWSPCLDLEWRGTRWRVVSDDDELVSLPWRAGQARRLLRRRRREAVLRRAPGRRPPDEQRPAGTAPPGAGPLVVVEQAGDWRMCAHPACGGLILLPAPGSAQLPEGACPRCHRR